MNDSFRPKNKFARFMEGNGFYLALAVCIIGAGAAAWIAVERGGNSVTQPAPSASQQASPSSSYGFPDLEQAQETEKPQDDIVVPPAPSTSSPSTSSAASAAAPKPASTTPAQPVPDAEPQPTATTPSSFVMPISGEVFNPYSGGELVKNETLKEWRTHDGIDIKADLGAAVKAVCDGTVTVVKDDPLMGCIVEILHHDDITSVYCGLSKDVSVAEGDAVKVGQAIGAVGEIPAEIKSGAHLHFAIKVQDKYADPLKTMDLA